MELPVSQFLQGKTCFHNREPCSHCRDPVFITGLSLQTPVLPCTGLQCNFGLMPYCHFPLEMSQNYSIDIKSQQDT